MMMMQIAKDSVSFSRVSLTINDKTKYPKEVRIVSLRLPFRWRDQFSYNIQENYNTKAITAVKTIA